MRKREVPPSTVDGDKFQLVPNRKDMRRMGFRNKKSQPKLRARQPQWMHEVYQRVELNKVLRKIPVTGLESLPSNAAKALSAAGYNNVAKLARAKSKDLLAVKGIGPATLTKVHSELSARGVSVKWDA